MTDFTVSRRILSKAAAVAAVSLFLFTGFGPQDNTATASTQDNSTINALGLLPQGLAGHAAHYDPVTGFIYVLGGQIDAEWVPGKNFAAPTQCYPYDDIILVSAGGYCEYEQPQDADYNEEYTYYTDKVLGFDPDTYALWEVAGAALPEGRGWFGSTWYGGSAFIFGGYTEGAFDNTTDEILKFTPAADGLTGATTLIGTLPYPAHSIAVANDGDHAYLFGGKTGPLITTPDPTGPAYDADGNRCVENSEHRDYNPCSAEDYRDRTDNTGYDFMYHNETLRFDLTTELVDPTPVAFLPRKAYGMSATYDDGNGIIVLIGGKYHGQGSMGNGHGKPKQVPWAYANTTLHFAPDTLTFTEQEPTRRGYAHQDIEPWEDQDYWNNTADFGPEVYRWGAYFAGYYNNETSRVHVAGGYGAYLFMKGGQNCGGNGYNNKCYQQRMGTYPWISNYNASDATGLDDVGTLTQQVYGAAVAYDADAGYAFVFGGRHKGGTTHSDQIVRFQDHLHESIDFTPLVSGNYTYGSPVDANHPYHLMENATHAGDFSTVLTYRGKLADQVEVTIRACSTDNCAQAGAWIPQETRIINTTAGGSSHYVNFSFDPVAAGVKAGAAVFQIDAVSLSEPDLVAAVEADIVLPVTIHHGCSQYSCRYTITEPVIINSTLRYHDGSPAGGVEMTITEDYVDSSLEVFAYKMVFGSGRTYYNVETRADGQVFLNLGNPRYNPHGDGSLDNDDAYKAQGPGEHRLTFEIDTKHATNPQNSQFDNLGHGYEGYHRQWCVSWYVQNNENKCHGKGYLSYPRWYYEDMSGGYAVYDGDTGLNS